jgi:hypothetical protein
MWTIAAQLAAWLLTPYSRRKLTAKKLLTFPRDPLLDDDGDR